MKITSELQSLITTYNYHARSPKNLLTVRHMSAYCDFIADYFRQGGTISFKPFDAQMKFFYVTKPCEFSAIYKRAPYNTLVLSECPPEADYAEFIYDMNNPMAGPEPRINFYIYKELRARGVEIPWARNSL